MRALLLTTLLASPPLHASSGPAWIEHYQHVTHSCLSASGLRNATPQSDLMIFSDEIGTALLVRGQRADSDSRRTVLCIFRRGSEQVEVQTLDEGVEIDPETWAKELDEPCC